MNCFFETSLADKYKSLSQKIRVMTESWVSSNIFCPVCGNDSLQKQPNNSPVSDFRCPFCHNEYELKSSKTIGKRIADGSYETFIQRITSNTNPDFLFLQYDPSEMKVGNLWFVPKFFFTPSIIEKRPPLKSTSKRAGWVGCNIMLGEIPNQGRISIVQDSSPVNKTAVLNQVLKAKSLFNKDIDSRTWMFDVLKCINNIGKIEFSLSNVYEYENLLKEKYPENHNIRAKIRQQLQKLRDRNVIAFLGNGHYRLV